MYAATLAVSSSRARTFLALLATIFAIAACDGSELSSTFPDGGEGSSGSQDARDPESFVVQSGADQSAAPGEMLPQPVAVRVAGSGNRPIRNMDVEFVVISGGGSVSSSSAATDRDGIASNRWTLGSAVGTQTLEARIVHPGKGTVLASARINATAIEGGSGGDTPAAVSFGSDSFVFAARGETILVPVTATNGQGNQVGSSALAWTSSNATVARVDASGLITAWDDGTAHIVGSLGGASDTATVIVERQGASISIVAPSSTIEAGQEVALSTRVEDANGHPVGMTLAQLNWSVSGANAEINAAGLLRTIEPGQLEVSARYDNLEGSTQLTVVEPSMPGTPVFADGLESGSLSAWDDGANSAYHTVVRDPSLARSGDHVLRVDYPAGGSAGYLTTFFGPGHETARIRFWVQLGEGWEGSSTLAGLYGSRTDDIWSAHGQAGVCPNGTNHFSSFIAVGGGSSARPLEFSTAHMREEAPCYGDDGAGQSSLVSGHGLVPGMWHRVEFEVRANTAGRADGSQSMWIDGELVGQWNGLEFRAGSMLALNSAQLGFAAEGGSHGARYLLIDDVEVTTVGAQTPGETSVTIDQAPPAFAALGAQQQLTATVTDPSGASVASATPTWSSANPAVAAVDAQGRVTSMGNGSTTITAAYGGASASVPVTVQQTVALVRIDPANLGMTVGESRTFTATPQDANGRTVSGLSVVWSSSSNAVASVNTSGRVSAVGAGSATISARASDVVGTASVSVSGDSGGGGGGGGGGAWSNLPAGLQTLTDQPWQALGSLGWGHNNTQSESVIVADPTAPTGDGSVLEFRFPAGYEGGSAPAVEWINTGGSDAVFVGFWMKVDPNWTGHPTGSQKIAFIRNAGPWGTDPDAGDNLFLLMDPVDGGSAANGPFQLAVANNGGSHSKLPDPIFPNTGSDADAEIVPGRWHKVEWLVDRSNGLMRWWLDGALIGNYTGIEFDGTYGFGEVTIPPVWGGLGSTKPKDEYWRFDNTYIAVRH